MANIFGVQIFFIVFRECLEAVIIVSVLLSFLKKALGQPDQDPKIHKRLVRQVWVGTATGVLLCLIIGGAFIGVFYGLGKDIWSQSEDLWEGIFFLIAAIIITIMGLALLRINKTKEKWRLKIANALMENTQKLSSKSSRLADVSRRYVMFILPFITVLREGVEAVVFIGGVSLGLPSTAFPLPVVCGVISGLIVGYLIYRGGNVMSIQLFLIASTCVLYLIAAGMFSKAIWVLQFHVFADKVGADVAEEGDGPGSYDIKETVWHVNCCNPETDNGWDIFNAILGWQNTGTYGSVIGYNVYWLAIILSITVMMYQERNGALPGQKQAAAFMLKIPGLRKYVKKKEPVSMEQVDEMIRRIHEDARKDTEIIQVASQT